jgi:hypothetical protein
MKTEPKNIRDQKKTSTNAENNPSPLGLELASEWGAADLFQGLGEPHQIVQGRRTIRHWSAEAAPDSNGYLFEDGDGILVGRTATKHDPAYPHEIHQIQSLLKYSWSHSLKPREIIMVSGQSGLAAFQERWDLKRIQETVGSGTTKWFAYQNPDRVARRWHVLDEVLCFAEDTGTELHIPSLGGRLGPDEIAQLRIGMQLERLIHEHGRAPQVNGEDNA